MPPVAAASRELTYRAVMGDLVTGTRGIAQRFRAWRERVRQLPGGAVAWRVGVTVIGLLIVVVGLLLLPLPGPGWLVIFAGLGVLASEFSWAARLLSRLRQLVTRWTRWARHQSTWVQLLIGASGLAVLAAAIAGSWYLSLLV